MGKRFLFFLFLIVFLFSCQNRKAEKIYRDSISAWENEEYSDALQNFIAFTKTYPNHDLVDNALYWIGAIYQFDLKQPLQAISYYKILSQRFPNSDFFIKSSFYIAEIQGEKGRTGVENAIYTYQDILNSKNIQPDEEVRAYLGIAKNYIEILQYDNGRRSLKKALELSQADEKTLVDIYKLLALSYQKEGKLKLVEITYEEVASKVRKPSLQIKIYDKLAKVYENQGDLKNSILTYQKLLNFSDKELSNRKQYEAKIKVLKTRFARTTR